MAVRKSLMFLVILTFILAPGLFAQPSTDIYLFDLQKDGLDYSLSNPVNISNNEGYDNQPYFLPNGTGVLYSSERNGQTDIALYNIEEDSTDWITHTEGSEYSPTVMPGGNYISTILLEEDGTQLLWKYPISGGDPVVVVPDLVIGYHTWFKKDTLFSFVLGDPPTLHQSTLNEPSGRVIAENPGRSLHSIPGKNKISYIDKSDSTRWMIQSYDPLSGETEDIISTLEGSEDMAWTPSGIILMGQGSKLYAYRPESETGWYEIADLSKYGLSGITRLAVSPEGEKIAVVVME